MSSEQAHDARLRARRRLIGAIVLLGVGVIAFPLLFETQPRPIPVDIPIVIPPRDGAPPLALPAPLPAQTPAVPASAAPPPAAAHVPASAPTPVAEAKSVEAAPPRPAQPAPKPAIDATRPAVAAAPAPKLVPRPAAAAPKPVVAAPKPAPAAPTTPTAAGRFVVQIGAFAEANAVRDARSKAQKAGLSTFTQTVDTQGGKRTRVRVGPFASREEAEKAAAQIKAAGLPGSVMAL